MVQLLPAVSASFTSLTRNEGDLRVSKPDYCVKFKEVETPTLANYFNSLYLIQNNNNIIILKLLC